MFDAVAGDRVTADLVVELQNADGPDAALIDWPDATLTVEPDAAAATARGGNVVAPRRMVVEGDPKRLAFFLSGQLSGRAVAFSMGPDGTWAQRPASRHRD